MKKEKASRKKKRISGMIPPGAQEGNLLQRKEGIKEINEIKNRSLSAPHEKVQI